MTVIVGGCGLVRGPTTPPPTGRVVPIADGAEFEVLRGQGRPVVLVLMEGGHGCGCEAVLPMIDEVAAGYSDRVIFARADRGDPVG